MEKFLALTEEKQKAIIEAGFCCFGKMGYKKASVSDIASAAGISKGMIFHYFGSKKAMYLYLVNIGYQELIHAFETEFDKNVHDFFDIIISGTRCKIAAMREHPSLMKFLTSIYYESDSEVVTEVQEFLKMGEAFRTNLTLSDIDMDKFKDTVSPPLVLQLLTKYAEGYIGNMPPGDDFDMDKMLKEFMECVFMMKNNFYKEEYL